MNPTTEILDAPTVSATIQVLIDSFAARRAVLTAVQVGACKGGIENDPLHALIRGTSAVEAHLVEAVHSLYLDLVRSMDRSENPRIHCHNLVIGARDETRTFHSVSPRYSVDFPDAPSWKKYQIGSLTDEHLRLHVPEEYIQHDVVQSVSPRTFMDLAQIDPAALDLLLTDTEGFDGEIVTAFLDHTDPTLIVFEHDVMPVGDLDALLSLLQSRGYRYRAIGCDTVAVRD